MRHTAMNNETARSKVLSSGVTDSKATYKARKAMIDSDVLGGVVTNFEKALSANERLKIGMKIRKRA